MYRASTPLGSWDDIVQKLYWCTIQGKSVQKRERAFALALSLFSSGGVYIDSVEARQERCHQSRRLAPRLTCQVDDKSYLTVIPSIKTAILADT